MIEALCILELDGIGAGTVIADAMVKRATVDVLRSGTVQPGKYVIVVGGPVAEIEETLIAARQTATHELSDVVFLPDAHEQVCGAIAGKRRANDGDALAIIESTTLPATVLAADRAVKAADVSIVEIRLGDGLGGRGLTHLTGRLEDIQAAAEAAQSAGSTSAAIIPAQHDDLRRRVDETTRFGELGGRN
jgi:microcompartment protein CcmL/EutN